RLQGDWSSDVCSSDLMRLPDLRILRVLRMPLHAQRETAAQEFERLDDSIRRADRGYLHRQGGVRQHCLVMAAVRDLIPVGAQDRSEERRVGKSVECGG